MPSRFTDDGAPRVAEPPAVSVVAPLERDYADGTGNSVEVARGLQEDELEFGGHGFNGLRGAASSRVRQ